MIEPVKKKQSKLSAFLLRNLNSAEKYRSLDEETQQIVLELLRRVLDSQNALRDLFSTGLAENIFELLGEAVLVVEPAREQILIANSSACQIYRADKKKLLQKRFGAFWESGDEKLAFFEKLRAKGLVENFETIHLRADDAKKTIKISALLFRANADEMIVAVIDDSTQRSEAEQRIYQAKKEWSATVDALSDLIILEDDRGHLRRCNRATAQFFEKSFFELIGKPVRALIKAHGEENQKTAKTLAAPAHLRDAVWQGQIAGRENWYEITNHRLPEEPAVTPGWVHIVKDITERKRAEAELERLYTAIEQAADAILITDLNGSIQYVNASFEKMQGYGRKELVGRKISHIKAGFQENEDFGEMLSALLTGEICHRNYKSIRKNGEVYDEEATVSLARSTDGQPLHCVFVCRDITETRRLESIAEAVNMMNNVGYIFSGIRHELGNPINSVKTALTVLRQNLGKWDEDRIELYIERCLTETARVEYLLRTLKTFSMYESVQIQTISLVEYMEKFIALVTEDFRQKNIQIAFSSAADIGEALFDPRALHQVMLNLLANSADAFTEQTDRRISIKLRRTKNQIYVTIADNGAGISEFQKSNLFKPFYTSKPKGTGLGLVIVKSMLGKMNGTISIESVQTVGTDVTFTLEAAGREAAL